MLRRFLCTGLCVTAASTTYAAKPAEPRPIAGLRIGPETTVVSGPLNDLGHPDYIAALNDKLSRDVAPEENFWAAYCEILPRESVGLNWAEKLTTFSGFERACSNPMVPYAPAGTNFEHVNKQLEISMNRPWKRDEAPLIATWLEKNVAQLARATEACSRPKAYAPLITVGENATMVSVLLPHVQQARDTARAFSARAHLALGEGRGDDAWKDVLSLHRLAKHNERSPFLIGNLVGIAISAIARTPTEACLVDRAATPDVLARRCTELSAILGEEQRVPLWIDGERFCVLDITLAIRSRRASVKEMIGLAAVPSPGHWAADGLPEIDFTKAHEAFQSMMLKLGDVNETLEFTNRYYDRIEEAMSLPDFRDRQKAIEALDQESKSTGSADNVGSVAAAFFLGGPDAVESLAQRSVVSQFSAAFAQCHKAQARTIARTRLLHAGSAAQIHFLRTGVDVADSDQLNQAIRQYSNAIGVSLPEMKDPYVGDSFHLAHEKDRLVIYALGDNLKNDGGKTFGEGEGCDDIVVVLKR